MKNRIAKKAIFIIMIFIFSGSLIAVFCVFFDEAVLLRKGTVYRVPISEKVVALTFDDGPSLEWTPKILDKLKEAKVKATFFMLGDHVKMYPSIAQRVAEEGHEIENHTFTHHVLIYYTMDELKKEIKDTENIIQSTTGRRTKYFRPPKAWLTAQEKAKVNEMGYKIVLWSLNSKDWVTFDDKYMIRYILHHVHPGDIILFHDSGGVLSTQGGDRSETVSVIKRLVEKLRDKGYRCVTVEELLQKYGER
jgi:peptidoglycan-N-acetylglucosamine deacetylase